MWRRDERLAVVYAIAGRGQYTVRITGEANHAGATAMKDRHDALVGAARAIWAIEDVATKLGPPAVVTVGRITNHPNAVNVVPDRVEFTIDLRTDSDVGLDGGDQQIRELVQQVATRRGLQASVARTERLPPRLMNDRLCERLIQAGRARGFEEGLPRVMSGALHDSAVLSPHVPTAMLFVSSKDGISHNPAEFSRAEDIAEAARVVERVVRQTSLRQLNQIERDVFVATCGRFFEHSPWIAERAWEKRPFASLGDLHGKLCQTVARASADEQLALIRAHPDLVGRLAREGRLTHESTGEQAAAGLTGLSKSEIEAFEKHNAAYGDKFGFPFVICARQNRKDAILAAFPVRLSNSREQEVATALAEIYKIARLRLEDAIAED
jgi:OHCU decarboxylase